MIERVLGHLAAHGIDEAVLSLGYRPDAFIDAYPRRRVPPGSDCTYAVEPEPLDTAGAVRFAADRRQVDETFVVVNGDVLTDLDISALVDLPPPATAPRPPSACTPVADPSRLRRRPHRRRGQGGGLHREAAPRRGARPT